MKHLILILMMSCVTACNPVMTTFNAVKKDDDKSAKKTADNADAERVDIPNNISGSYLMCSLRKDASETDLSSEYGCRLNEAGTNNRLDLTALQNRIQWLSSERDGVSVLTYPSNSVWHALYRVTGPNLSSLREKAGRLQVQVQWSLPNGAPVSLVKDQKLIETLQPADVAGDTSAPVLQGQGLDPSDPGTL